MVSIIPLNIYEVSRVVKLIETKSRMPVFMGWGQTGSRELAFHRWSVSSGEDGNVGEMDGGDGCTGM